jgi:hypothetical protein
MLKINLIPPGIHRARQVKVATAVVALLVAAEVGVLIYARQAPMARNKELKDRLLVVESQRTALQKIGTDATAVLGEKAALEPKYLFMTGMLEYNKAYPAVYRNTARWTYREVTFLSLVAGANQVQFDGYVNHPRDVSRLMLGLSRAPHLQGLPTVTGVPGYDPEQEQALRTEERALESGNVPGSTIIGGRAPGGASVSASGMMGSGGYPGGGASGGSGGMMGMMARGGAGGYPGGGGSGGSGGMMGGGGMGRMGGGGGGGGSLEAFNIADARRKPRGFTVNVTCMLLKPISRPSYGNSNSASGGGGGGGGGMRPGGMGGGMGGNGGGGMGGGMGGNGGGGMGGGMGGNGGAGKG